MSDRAYLTIWQLCAECGVTPKYVHNKVSQRLLPPPVGPRSQALYSDEHVRRLREIARTRDERVTLADLRDRWTPPSDEDET